MKFELISVIIPIYKVERYLDRCINSIVNQTYKNLEIILVDDGSPDSCPQLCDRWAQQDERIRVIHQKNSGVSAARNRGIDISRGNYIVFVDADDWIDLRYIEEMIEMLKDYDVVASNFCVEIAPECSANTRIFKKFIGDKVMRDRRYFFEDCVASQIYTFTVWGKLFTRAIIGNTRFLPQAFSEDAIFCREILSKCHTICLWDNQGYHYRISQGSVTLNSARVEEKELGGIKLAIRTYELCNNLGYADLTKSIQDTMYINILGYLKIAVKNRIIDSQESLKTVKHVYRILPKKIGILQFKIIFFCLLYMAKIAWTSFFVEKDEG